MICTVTISSVKSSLVGGIVAFLCAQWVQQPFALTQHAFLRWADSPHTEKCNTLVYSESHRLLLILCMFTAWPHFAFNGSEDKHSEYWVHVNIVAVSTRGSLNSMVMFEARRVCAWAEPNITPFNDAVHYNNTTNYGLLPSSITLHCTTAMHNCGKWYTYKWQSRDSFEM